MTLKEFLKEAGVHESYSVKPINYEGDAALDAVRISGDQLVYVSEQTDEICLEAVQQKGWALQFVHRKTLAICLAAVKNDHTAIRFVDKSVFEDPND